jgi:predicted nucleic acid-binding protein
VFVAVLDAACLVPAVLTDTLLRLAESGLYRPLWSEQILDEVRRALIDVHPDLDSVAIARRLDMMNAAFEDASVETDAWQPLAESLNLPDPDDRHVLAAAIAGGADSIVTPNLKDFPAKHLAPHGVQAVSPDTFLLDQLDLSPPRVLTVLAEQAADITRPPLTVFDVLDKLSRAGAPSFANEALRHITG